MELGANLLERLRHGAANHLAFVNLTGTPVNDIAPLGLGVNVRDIVKTGDKLMGQEGPVLNRQRQHLGDFFRGNAHSLNATAQPVEIQLFISRVANAGWLGQDGRE
jgi:hypothetical protein